MILKPKSLRSHFRAPVIAGALSFLCLSQFSCEEKSGTPDWSEQKAEPVFRIGSGLEARWEPISKTAQVPAPGLRFMSYNVENWLTMERGGKQLNKPEEEKAAVVRLIVENRPEVLGICEIGDADDVKNLQERLKASGWEMKHLSYDEDSPALRRLALLSRHPIVEESRPKVQEYRMNGRNWRMSRPMLDATVEKEGARYRFLGVHFKSKREIRDADQNEMRINEAILFRRHVDDIIKADPQVRLITYGDFNDSRKSTAMKKVAGQYRTPTYLTAIPCGDSNGHRWTHHWEYQDIYSRFDYVLVSEALRSEVDFKGSYLVDDASWDKASDHRALLTIFKSTEAPPQ